jgi:hypothetical protein
MIRDSTLPERIAQDNLFPLDEAELRRLGETIQVYFSRQHCKLDVTEAMSPRRSLDPTIEPLIGLSQSNSKLHDID